MFNFDMTGVRIDLRDCDDGWACIRTRWHEDEQTKAEDKELRFNFEVNNGIFTYIDCVAYIVSNY